MLGNAAPLGLALLGLLLGMRHATDPDHVIAVTTILSRERRIIAATRIGIVWGLGHTATVVAVGAAIIVFKFAVPVRLGLAMEFGVAVVLILLGLGATTNLARRVLARLWHGSADELSVHAHAHTHGGATHHHPHVHTQPHASGAGAPHDDHRIADGSMPGLTAPRSLLKSFAVGLVHGLAGSAAIALLALSVIPNPVWATLYLVIFCIGVVIGMALVTTAIGAPFIFASQRMADIHHALVIGSGLLSFGFGLFLAYQIGVVDGLFGSAPIWMPH